MTPPTIQHLHEVFCELTGFVGRLDMGREHLWFDWCKYGFGEQDLRLVIGYLQREIRQQKRNPGCLKLSNLIARPDLFEEEKFLALSAQRVAEKARITPQMPAGRADVLRASGRTQTAPSRPIVTPAQIIGERPSVPQLIQRLKDAVK